MAVELNEPDEEMLSRLRAIYADRLAQDDPTGPTGQNPPEYVFNTPTPGPVGPPAQVYAGGGVVKKIGRNLFYVAPRDLTPDQEIRSLYDQLGAAAYDKFSERWPEAGELGQDHAHRIFFYDDLARALEHRNEFVPDGFVARINPDGLDDLARDPHEGFWNTRRSIPPGAWVPISEEPFSEGGAVDDYGAGRFTRTPQERRENRERAIAQHSMPQPEDDFLTREWQRYIDRHGGNPLSYGMEVLGRLDNAAGAASAGENGWTARDIWENAASPDPMFRRDYGYPGAIADALSIGSFGATGKIGKALGWAAPLIYGAGEAALEGAMAPSAPYKPSSDYPYLYPDRSQYGYAGGGKVAKLIKDVGKKFGDFQAQRVERAADETNLDRIHPDALREMFNPTNEMRLFTNMPPADFQDYASRIPQSAADMRPYPRSHNVPGADKLPDDAQSQDWYLDRLSQFMNKRGMYDAPELYISRAARDLPNVIEHEGRHRMMAMDRMGDPSALVKLNLYGQRPFDWREMDPEGKVEWMKQRYFPRGGSSMIVPQDRPVPRALYSEPYAGGGRVLSTIERLVGGKPKEVKLPSGERMPAFPIREFEDVADKFATRYGNAPIESYPKLDEDRARKIARAYDEMQHDPLDPRVKRAYDALIDETMDQYRALEGTGAKFEFLKPGEGDPYAASPSLGYKDLIENGRLKVFPTDQGYGTQTDISDNPLLRRVGRVGDLENATANDAFRVVHDALGHFGPGNPFFRAPGEERAWLNHMRAYSPDALPAATSETRGQNSWVNFGPQAERNRGASGADTVYADQKAGLLPEWMYNPNAKDATDDIMQAIGFDPTEWATSRPVGPSGFPFPIGSVANRQILDVPSAEIIPFPRKPSYRDGGRVLKLAKRFLSEPLRESFPGVYKDPDKLVGEAREHIVPDPGKEGPMYRLFGHTRDSLDELSQGNRDLDSIRPFLEEHPYPLRGDNEVVHQLMNKRNANRLVNSIGEALADPQLRTTRSWYEMSPMWDRANELGVGDKGMRDLNNRMAVMSAGSDPRTEINRGFHANWLANEGRLDDFVRHGGTPDHLRDGDFPDDLRSLMGHAYHSTAHLPNLLDYESSGRLWPTKHKVPTYAAATDPKDPYWQRPIADNHFSRIVGFPDVSTASTDAVRQGVMPGTAYSQFVPWFNDKVASQLDMRPRDAQALLWNLGGPQTGVRYIGPSKLEMISDYMNEVAKLRQIAPEQARDDLLQGKIGGAWDHGSEAPFAEGGRVDDDLDLYHVAMNMRKGGSVLPYSQDRAVDDDFLGYLVQNNYGN